MPRTRSKSAPRLTRDAERLIALANGLHTSGSLTEDRFWESEMAALVEKLLENGNDAPLDAALDHLYQGNVGAYDVLIERIDGVSEALPEEVMEDLIVNGAFAAPDALAEALINAAAARAAKRRDDMTAVCVKIESA